MKDLAISKALLLLNDKKALELTIKSQSKLNEIQVPPTSIRFGTKLTSPIPEVVASPMFQEYKDQFNAGLGTFQDLALNLFKKTKTLERETAEQKLRATFNTHFHKLIETRASLELTRIPSTRDIETVKELGGHNILVAQAWKRILNTAASPPNAGETNTTLHATILNELASYLHISLTDFKTELNAKFSINCIDQQTRNTFTTALSILNISSTIEKLEDYILTISDKMTTLIYENYAKRQREKEATDKIRAEIKAQEISDTTTTVNDIIESEDTMSSPKMIDFINSQIKHGIADYIAKNSKGQSKPGINNSTKNNNNNNKTRNNKNKSDTSTKDTENSVNTTTSNQTPSNQKINFTPSNGNKRQLSQSPHNPYNIPSNRQHNQNQRRRYNNHQDTNRHGHRHGQRNGNKEREERGRGYHDGYVKRNNNEYRR